MRRALIILIAGGALAFAGCSKSSDDKEGEESGGETASTADEADTPDEDGEGEGVGAAVANLAELAEQIGVEPGPVEAPDDTGPEAVLSDVKGAVSVRRTGTEVFEEASGDVELFPGDQVRTEAEATATVTFADETVVQVAELSALAVGDRESTADPASSALVMAGVARFTVAERGPGEGPFLAYTPTAIVGTKGTTYGVGVAVTGKTRVGVEEGEVEVAGSSSLDAPVAVATGTAAEIDVDGAVGEPADFANDDWGEWRDAEEAAATPEAVVEIHTGALADLEAETEAAYDELDSLAATGVELEAGAEAAMEAGDTGAYDATAPDRAANIEASYLASVRLQHLTFAMLAHAYLAHEVHLRHPDATRVVFEPAAPRVHATVLYNKKYRLVVRDHVRPRRMHYYYHHPRGRAHAAKVKVEVPGFYRKRKLRPVARADVDARLGISVYRPPAVVRVRANKRVWVGRPATGWRADVKVRPRPPRAKAGWYVRAKSPRGKVVTGVKVRDHRGRVFEKVRVKTPSGGVRIGINRPGKKVRAHKRPGGNTTVRVKKPGVRARGEVEAGAGARVRVKKPGAKAGVKVRTHKGKAGAKVRTHKDTAGGAKVRVKKPNVKAGAKVEAGAGVRVGGKKKVRTHKKEGATRDHR